MGINDAIKIIELTTNPGIILNIIQTYWIIYSLIKLDQDNKDIILIGIERNIIHKVSITYPLKDKIV